MKLTKAIKDELMSLTDDADETRKLLWAIAGDFIDCRTREYRLVRVAEIDSIMKEELLGDQSVLGCCAPWFIADITGIELDVVVKAQKSEHFELLGSLMASHIDNVVEGIVSNDGYGPHFAPYDGKDNEIVNGEYHLFRL